MSVVTNKKILKAAREKQLVTYKETCIRLSADILAKILQARRVWQNIFKGLEKKKKTTFNQEYSIWLSYYLELKES